MSESEYTIVEQTDTLTLDELEQQLADARGNPDVTSEQVIDIALAIASTKKLAAKVERDAEAAAAKAEHDAKMSEVNPLMQTSKDALDLLLGEVQEQFVAAGIHDLTISVKNMHEADTLKSVKCAGPGLPKTTSSASAGTGAKRGRNVYEYQGQEYNSRELLEAFGQEHFGDKTLEAVGFSHRADALAEKLGAVKTKRTNGDD